MKHLQYFLGILFLLLCMTACHYRTTLSSAVKNGPEDSVAVSVQKERPYALNTPVCTEQQFSCDSRYTLVACASVARLYSGKGRR